MPLRNFTFLFSTLAFCFAQLLFILTPSSVVFSEPSDQKQHNEQMVLIESGEFTMGSVKGEYDEKPPHTIYLARYYIAEYEVTNREYRLFIHEMGHKPPKIWGQSDISPTSRYPVVGVSWEDAVKYTKWLSNRKARRYHLPTEAQWEKAARGVKERVFPWGNSLPDKAYKKGKGPIKANYVSEKDQYRFTAPVGSFKEGISPYGIFDMAGNVWEWCLDWYGDDYYKKSPKNNPQGPASGSFHIIRGGGWTEHPYSIRTTTRKPSDPLTYRRGLIGFRVAMDAKSMK